MVDHFDPIVLTDSPDVVNLKQEFRECDGYEQYLRNRPQTPDILAQRAKVSARKQEIATLIFQQQRP